MLCSCVDSESQKCDTSQDSAAARAFLSGEKRHPNEFAQHTSLKLA